ncbi:FAD-dependent oxidoreductase [Bacillus sp. J37]|uniref:protoporphyrinogen/coproporphyrinogen oxidase n=1 Tax=Bacillus sp. J37 TaxID=935837 RepID=UPI0004790B8F|nr:FAD-dependent oxidoreductase [Bacillus sp. J37]
MITYVIGAGVTGLSFVKVFGDDAEILESKKELGGKALSYQVETDVGDFGFDIGGHWFHHKSAPEALELLEGLELESHKRNAYIYLDGQFFDFPIQQSYIAHSNLDFVKRVERDFKAIQKDHKLYDNYNDMLLESYGFTLYESFFRNYNMKMLGIEDLSRIGIGNYEKKRNVRIDEDIKGYNDDFVYPKGVIGAKGIPIFLAKNAKVNFNSKVKSINLEKKTIEVNKKNITWKNLISTMPLTSLVKIISDIDPEILRLSKKLESTKGMILNIGVKRNPIHGNKSWVYIPSLDYSFYRIGFYSNIEPLLAPKGYVSMYVECSPLFFQNKKEALALVPKVIDELIEIGFIGNKEEIVTSRSIYLEHNYCLPNIRVSERIRSYLEAFGIYSIGRYGTWHWSSQHEDMKQAINLVKKLKTDSTIDKTILQV